jgi:hypothetical protein
MLGNPVGQRDGGFKGIGKLRGEAEVERETVAELCILT